MKRIEKYFKEAMTCQADNRMIGVETESLFLDNGQPISLKTSQGVMKKLITDFGYRVKEEKNSFITKVEKNGFVILYEIGWNNFELITTVFSIENINTLFVEHDKMLYDLYLSSKSFGVKMLNASWDGKISDTLIIPDKRDSIWLELDGTALYGLGHIACIHLNIDLVSINEGMKWIEKLNKYYQQAQWPPKENYSIWQKYITTSLANYENDRYGCPPNSFADYCQKLSKYKVVMNRLNGILDIVNPTVPFVETENVDIDLFLRSVWWWFRLRVRDERLVLEIRDIPRPLGVKKAFLLIKEFLLL